MLTDAIDPPSDDKSQLLASAGQNERRNMLSVEPVVIPSSNDASHDDLERRVMIHQGKLKAVNTSENDEVVCISDSNDSDDRATYRIARHATRHKATVEYGSRLLQWHDDNIVIEEFDQEPRKIDTLDGSDFEEADDPDADHSDWSDGRQDIPSHAPRSLSYGQCSLSDHYQIGEEDISEVDSDATPSNRHKRLHSTGDPTPDKRPRRLSSQTSSRSSSIDRTFLYLSNVPRRTQHSAYDGDGNSASNDLDSDDSDSFPSKAWPRDFFVVDVVKGFAEIDTGRQEKQTLAATFEAYFGVNFKSATYHDHQVCWNAAHPHAKELALSYHRTKPEGLWSHFMRSNPAKNASIKAAQKKLREHAKQVGKESSRV